MTRSFFLLLVLFTANLCSATTFTVTSIADSGAGSLRQAVLDAVGGDDIQFDGSLLDQIITLNSPITIDFDLTITGPGADRLDISGGNTTRMFTINTGAEVTVSGLSFVDGNAGFGGAVAVSGAGTVLNIEQSQFLNNTAGSTGGAIDNNGATLNIISSTLSGNQVGTFGGAINNAGGGFLMIRNSTLSGNQAGADGGAITNLGGTEDIANSTVINNFADNFAGGLGNNSPSVIVNIRNTIVAGNTTGTGSGRDIGNLAGQPGIVSGGGNLIGIAQGPGDGDTIGVFDQPDDQTGSLAAPLDPLLGIIDDNGGPTLTHLPLLGSPAIDRGINTDLPLDDQRGMNRLFNEQVDVGSVEVQPVLAETFFVDGFELAE